MSNSISWFRLPRGRVWHVALGGLGLCGERLPARGGEWQPNLPPFGARPCSECVAVTEKVADTIAIAQGLRDAKLPDDGIVDAEIVDDGDGWVDNSSVVIVEGEPVVIGDLAWSLLGDRDLRAGNCGGGADWRVVSGADADAAACCCSLAPASPAPLGRDRGAPRRQAYERLLRREIRTQHRAALAAQVALDRWPVAAGCTGRKGNPGDDCRASDAQHQTRRDQPVNRGQHAAIAVDIERALLRAVVTQQQSRHAEETDAALGALAGEQQPVFSPIVR